MIHWPSVSLASVLQCPGSGPGSGHERRHGNFSSRVQMRTSELFDFCLNLFCTPRVPSCDTLTLSSFVKLDTLVEVLLYVHRNRRFIRDGSPGRPPTTFTQLLSFEAGHTLSEAYQGIIPSQSKARVYRYATPTFSSWVKLDT